MCIIRGGQIPGEIPPLLTEKETATIRSIFSQPKLVSRIVDDVEDLELNIRSRATFGRNMCPVSLYCGKVLRPRFDVSETLVSTMRFP